AEDGIRDGHVTGVQTCALPIWWATAAILGGLVLLAFYDQTTRGFAASFAAWADEYRQDDRFVKKIEASLPPGAHVFELPYFPYQIGRASCRERGEISVVDEAGR